MKTKLFIGLKRIIVFLILLASIIISGISNINAQTLPYVLFNGDTLSVYPTDNSQSTQWGSLAITANATSYLNGKANTDSIIKYQGAVSYAAQLCAGLDAYGYTDWYLPAINELNALYLNRNAIGGFNTGDYWSSTESINQTAFSIYFYNAGQNGNYKTNYANVRCVRKGGSILKAQLPFVIYKGDSLFVSPKDNSNNIRWYNGSYNTTNTTDTTNGKANCDSIIKYQGSGKYAARVCYDLDTLGYTDWYLPAKDELNAVLNNINFIGGFRYANYWSSNENLMYYAWTQLSFKGNQVITSKSDSFNVRCVRRVINKIFPIHDIDGNGYDTARIGAQTWLKQNLKSTKYNDGSVIPNVTDNSAWLALSTPAYCTYNNTTNADTINTYGRLYNWYTVNTGKLCPTGWHVPSDAEFSVLSNYLGGDSVAGSKLKETGTKHWSGLNTDATNETGFTALPGGIRSTGGYLRNIGISGNWWSATAYDSANVWYRYLGGSSSILGRSNYSGIMAYGLSVRCIKGELPKPTCYTSFTSSIDTLTGTATYLNTTTGNNKYYWIFDDGDFSNSTSPTHKYSKEGIYRVSLTATDTSTGCQSKIEKEIKIKTSTIEPCRAIYTFTLDTLTKTLTLTNTSSTGIDRNYWEFGDGTLSNDKSPSHTYNAAGYYKVSLTVIDTNTICFDIKTNVVKVDEAQKPCKADFTYNVDLSNQKIYFANQSEVPVNPTYLWDFADGSTSTIANPEHTYKKGDFYDVCLTISEQKSKCRNTTCQNLKASNISSFCDADFTYSVDTSTGNVNFYDNSIGSPTKWDWIYGDGTKEEVKQAKHNYPPGYYTVQLKITDSITSNTSFDVAKINIKQPQKLKAGFAYDKKAVNGKGVLPVEFKGASYGDASEVEWDFGDGTTNNSSIAPTHDYAKEGAFTACLKVYNAYTGESDSTCQQIEVTSTGIEKQTKNSSIAIYPNPAKDYLTIVCEQKSNGSSNNYDVEITNSLGQVVLNAVYKQSTFNIDISAIPTGVYFLKVQTNDRKIVKRFVKM